MKVNKISSSKKSDIGMFLLIFAATVCITAGLLFSVPVEYACVMILVLDSIIAILIIVGALSVNYFNSKIANLVNDKENLK